MKSRSTIPVESARRKRPLVLFNSDGAAGTVMLAVTPTPEQVCRQLNELEGTSVDAFLLSVTFGSDIVIYPSKVAELWGPNVKDWSTVWPKWLGDYQRSAANLKSLQERGLDVIELHQRRAQELGIQLWISQRMNDQHESDERDACLRSQFKLANRHLLLGKNYPLTLSTPTAEDPGHPHGPIGTNRRHSCLEENANDP